METLVSKILKRKGKEKEDHNMSFCEGLQSALDRLEQLHKAEAQRDKLQKAVIAYRNAPSLIKSQGARARLFETLACQLNPTPPK